MKQQSQDHCSRILHRTRDLLKRFGYAVRSELNTSTILAEFLTKSQTGVSGEYATTICRSLTAITEIVEDFETELKNILKDNSGNEYLPRETQAQVHARGRVAPEVRITSPAASRQTVDSVSAQGRILVVEDNQLNQTLIKRILERHGYDVSVVTSGEEALKTLASIPFDLIFMDISLPGIDGFETTVQIKGNPDIAEIPVVALSAHSDQEMKETAAEVGMLGYLEKPIDGNALMRMLKSILFV